MSFPSDLEIARQATLKPINQIATDIGLDPALLEHYGENVAKIKLGAIEALSDRPRAKYVCVTAITPTPLGEGKTTTTVGLGQAMGHIGKRATISIRQPSMGPTFGIKGGAAGGGYSQAVPMEAFNLHLTGDMHAVTAAHNMLSAMVDNHLHQGNALGLDLHNITWRRVLDVNDRALRNIIVGHRIQRRWCAAADGFRHHDLFITCPNSGRPVPSERDANPEAPWQHSIRENA
jgi:formate--tetrahydrofolate ligase